jgi:hypothetical protein
MSTLLTDAPDIPASDFLFAREMAEALHAAYPGHLWAVTAESERGVATIRNLSLSGDWAYTLHLPKVYSMSSFRHKVKMAGGEMLERYNLTRGVVDHAAIAALPVDRFGRTLGDHAR